MNRELSRKLIHLSTAIVPLAVWWLPRDASVAVLAVGLAVAVLVELARSRSRLVRFLFLRRTRTMLRPHERDRWAGATYMALGYLLAVLLFPMPVAVAAMLYNGLGDTAAALVGSRWGRRRTAWGKSLEGFGAAAAVCFAIGLAIPPIPPLAAFAGAAAAALFEFLPLPVDDNLRITLGGGAALWAALLLMG